MVSGYDQRSGSDVTLDTVLGSILSSIRGNSKTSANLNGSSCFLLVQRLELGLSGLIFMKIKFLRREVR